MSAEIRDSAEAGVLQSLDFEESRCCESPDPCSDVATTLMVHRCCGRPYQLCERHVDWTRGLYRLAERHHAVVECLVCHVDAPFPALYPLGGAS